MELCLFLALALVAARRALVLYWTLGRRQQALSPDVVLPLETFLWNVCRPER